MITLSKARDKSNNSLQSVLLPSVSQAGTEVMDTKLSAGDTGAARLLLLPDLKTTNDIFA